MPTINVIYGPPCAGKSSLAKSRKNDGDVLIDFDLIASAVGAESSHDSKGSVRLVALSARQSAINRIMRGIEDDAFIIHTAPQDDLLKEYKEKKVNFILVDPGIDVCLDRAKSRPEGTEQAVRDWYNNPPDIKPSETVKGFRVKSDIHSMADELFDTIKAYVDNVNAKAVAKINAVESIRTEPGPKGEKGDAGQSVTLADVMPIIERAMAEIPAPKDGKDGIDGKDGHPGSDGKDGAPGSNGTDGKDGMPGADGRDGIDGKDGAPGIDGKDGSDGRDGKDGLPGKDGLDGKDGERGIDGKDGTDGRDGIDGKSFTLEDVRGMLEGECAKWALDFERRAQDTLQRAIDRIPAPKDGKDGLDGLGFDDLRIERTSARGFALVWSRDGQDRRHELSLPAVIDRGVYQSEKTYEEGDGVTHLGSYWIAQKDAPTELPGTAPDQWRLAVKKGRDGRHGKDGEKGDQGLPGRPSRD